ncbi:hypothetical protein E2C01_042590 [Portunus trituberculatus]|uniref:Uncharacterized protein n=1 Tax=Portunus trituberculatus TaxID=210409 RepID=A0A5B7FTV1_PORTR|nr:hypothetical protein [Portunus trituberculatus]
MLSLVPVCMAHVKTLPVRGTRSRVGHSCLFVVSCLSCVLSRTTTNMPLPDNELFNIKYQIAKLLSTFGTKVGTFLHRDLVSLQLHKYFELQHYL